MLIRIKKVEYISDYKLKLLFSDEKTKIVDFKDWIKEETTYLLPLKDIRYFKKVQLDAFNYTICWPNGADFCPDVLYAIGEEIQEQKKHSKPHTRRVKCQPAYALTKKTPKKTKSHP